MAERVDPGAAGAAGAAGASAVEQDRRLRHGPGRVLVAVYAVFALSATVRAVFQIAEKFSVAPLAYLLSLLSGLVYVVATVALARASARSWRVAVAAVAVELVGVLLVGTLTVTDAAAFQDATVWSDFGAGYGYVPLVLPLLGAAWLHRTRPGRPAGRTRPA